MASFSPEKYLKDIQKDWREGKYFYAIIKASSAFLSLIIFLGTVAGALKVFGIAGDTPTLNNSVYVGRDNYGNINVEGRKPRQLTLETRGALVSELSSLGATSVILYFDSVDPETRNFAGQIDVFLRSKGYETFGLNNTRVGTGLVPGTLRVVPVDSSSGTARLEIGPEEL